MMVCMKCGAAVRCRDSEGDVWAGEFTETYECANGHTGIVTGDARNGPSEWDRNGTVFDG